MVHTTAVFVIVKLKVSPFYICRWLHIKSEILFKILLCINLKSQPNINCVAFNSIYDKILMFDINRLLFMRVISEIYKFRSRCFHLVLIRSPC